MEWGAGLSRLSQIFPCCKSLLLAQHPASTIASAVVTLTQGAAFAVCTHPHRGVIYLVQHSDQFLSRLSVVRGARVGDRHLLVDHTPMRSHREDRAVNDKAVVALVVQSSPVSSGANSTDRAMRRKVSASSMRRLRDFGSQKVTALRSSSSGGW